MTSITVEATKPLGVKPRDAERSKNFFALGLICWMYTRPTDPLIDWIKKRFANRPEVFEANVAAFRAGLQLRRDRRALRPRVRGQARAARAGRVPPDHRQRRAVVRARRRRAGREAAVVLRVVPDHARLRHPARAVEAEELRREDAAGRRRDLGRRYRDRRRVRRQPRDHGHEWSRRRPEVGGARARGEPRAADDHRRRAARRPVDRSADQDRAGRPDARDVRASRRGADADRRRELAERLLRRRVRSGAASRSSTARR